jgi:hypothetical protein
MQCRYFAISFKYYGATNTLPSRWRLECLGERKFVPFNYAMGEEDYKIQEGLKFLNERFQDNTQRQFVWVGSCVVGDALVYLFDYSKVAQ